MINKVIFQWKAVYMETCTYGLEAGTGKPTAEMRKGVPCRAYDMHSAPDYSLYLRITCQSKSPAKTSEGAHAQNQGTQHCTFR